MFEPETLSTAWRFLVNLSPYELLTVFWFTVLLEVPRYFLSFVAVVIAVLVQRKHPSGPMPLLPKVSILIAGHNEEASIERCVDSLREQTYTTFEIVCVDDGSSDRTFAILRKLEQ